MFSSAVLILTLVSAAYAELFITAPVGSTTLTGGQEATISWQDNGVSPTLAEFGDAKVSVYAGNALQQTQLQEIVASVNVASTSSIQFTPDASIGPNSAEYFIRFESLNLKDAGAPQFPALAFSAKFTMSGMSGTFNSAVQAQIDGQSTAPLAGQTSAASSATGSVSASTTARSSSASASGSTTRSASSSAASATSSDNAAMTVSVGGMKVWMTLSACVLLGASLF